MIGKQEADRIVAAISDELSMNGAAALESANARGAIMLMLTQKTADELRGLVDFERWREFRRYRITGLGRAVIAKWLRDEADRIEAGG